MNIEAKNREEYFKAAGERESILRELDKLIRKATPDMKPVLAGGMKGKMLGYGTIPYKSATSRGVIDWPLVSLAAQKNYISLYICWVKDGKYIPEQYAPKLGKVSVGKSCIRFKKLEDLNLDTVKILLEEMNERYKSGEKLYGH
jgi:hypothetical protein